MNRTCDKRQSRWRSTPPGNESDPLPRTPSSTLKRVRSCSNLTVRTAKKRIFAPQSKIQSAKLVLEHGVSCSTMHRSQITEHQSGSDRSSHSFQSRHVGVEVPQLDYGLHNFATMFGALTAVRTRSPTRRRRDANPLVHPREPQERAAGLLGSPHPPSTS